MHFQKILLYLFFIFTHHNQTQKKLPVAKVSLTSWLLTHPKKIDSNWRSSVTQDPTQNKLFKLLVHPETLNGSLLISSHKISFKCEEGGAKTSKNVCAVDTKFFDPNHPSTSKKKLNVLFTNGCQLENTQMFFLSITWFKKQIQKKASARKA